MHMSISTNRVTRPTLSAAAITLGVALVAAMAPAAQASAVRTFVASTGNDANASTNCGLGAPCRTFSAAYSATLPGGEIVALDSAGYGVLTITGPVSIVGAQVASVTVPANSTGITISAGPSDRIILRNLQINGGGAANSTGIAVGNNAGHLTLENSTLKLLALGLSISSAKANLVNSDVVDNTTGIATFGTGIPSQNNSGANAGLTEVRIAGGNVLDNTTAFTMANPGVDNFNQNNVTIWYNGGVMPNVAGNSTVTTVTGTGSSCSNFMGNNVCVPAAQYSFNGNNFQ
jgi:hypothetical protein